ncbi:MAG: M42 family metallopeptidase [Fretibacterium sp.]|nr:M42 family metallopeptidase [Fretibacterium sp.]
MKNVKNVQSVKKKLDYTLKLTLDLLAIPSVSGDCDAALARVRKEFNDLGLPCRETNKRALIATWNGADDSRHRLIAAHIDTLGADVRLIKENGRLRLRPIGGLDWRSLAGENGFVRTLEGKEYRGTLMPDHAARHAFPEEVRNEPHTLDTVEFRLDVRTGSKSETEALGIHCGDLVFFDPRTELTDTGYLKSRFLDDKAGVALILGAIRQMKEQGLSPAHTTHFYITNYEEIGHGAPVIPERTVEFTAIDIGVVAEGTASSEHAVTILARDNITHYDRPGILQLKRLAEEHDIPYRIDGYQNYGSDASVALRCGKDLSALCFGPGAEATHHYERTHLDSLEATLRLLILHLQTQLL